MLVKTIKRQAATFQKEVTERSLGTEARLSGATERGSAKMVKPEGLAPNPAKAGAGVKSVGAHWATSFTSHVSLRQINPNSIFVPFALFRGQ